LHAPPLVPDGRRTKSTPRGFSNNPAGVGGLQTRRRHIWPLMPDRVVCGAPTRGSGQPCLRPPVKGKSRCALHGGRAGVKRLVPSGERAIFNKLIHDERRWARKTLAAILNAGTPPEGYGEQMAIYLPQIYPADEEIFALQLIERLNGALTLEEWHKAVREFRARRERFLGQSWRTETR
jgi:hypothetical protein